MVLKFISSIYLEVKSLENHSQMQTTDEQYFIPNNSPFFMFQNQGLSKV